MAEHVLDTELRRRNTGFVARHEHLWLGLMLLALHAATAWGIGTAWAAAFLLTHFGLFLMWQPLWQGDGELQPRYAILALLIGALLATAGSWWLIALWLTALTALIGGGMPGITQRRQRTASLLAALYLLALLLIWVVPQFEATFAQAGKALPLPTLVVVTAGKFMRAWWWALAAVIALVIIWYRRRGRNPVVRHRRDARLLRIPLLGDLIGKVETARFARTLSTLLANGVTLLAALSIVKETMTNVVMAGALDGVIGKLREGKGFGRPLADTGLYPRLASQMILVGEESGRLEEMLARVAEVYDREVQTAIKRFLSVLEPILILSLAVMIGGIVFSILMGVMGMSELVV